MVVKKNKSRVATQKSGSSVIKKGIPDRSYTVGGLFSGVGGIELGFKRAGFELLWSNEFDRAAQTTFIKNFKHSLVAGDIHDLRASHVEPVDVLVGGFPCQAFSVAGYRKGFKDPRGNLFFQIARLIDELNDTYGEKPRVLLLENVKNFYTHDKGNTFKVVLETLNELGYFVFHGVLNTFGCTPIPQNRERTFLVCFNETGVIGEQNLGIPGTNELQWSASAVEMMKPESGMPMSKTFIGLLPLPLVATKSIHECLTEGAVDRKYYYGKDRYMYEELVNQVKLKDTVYQWRRHYVRQNMNNVCPTLTANMGTGGHNVPLIKVPYGIRKLTPRECFNFQGFPKRFNLPMDKLPDSQLYKQAGNSVTVTLIKKLAKMIRVSLEAAEE